MRRRYVYGVVWVVATAVAAGGSWLGVRSMLGAGDPQRSVPLSAADLREVVPTPTPLPPPSPTQTPTPTPTPKPKPTKTPRPTPTDEWRRVGDRDGVPTFERTFRVTGGTVTFRCSEKEVDDVRVTPKRDYEDSIQRFDDTEMRVSFVAERNVSRVYVEWDGQECRAEVSESV